MGLHINDNQKKMFSAWEKKSNYSAMANYMLLRHKTKNTFSKAFDDWHALQCYGRVNVPFIHRGTQGMIDRVLSVNDNERSLACTAALDGLTYKPVVELLHAYALWSLYQGIKPSNWDMDIFNGLRRCARTQEVSVPLVVWNVFTDHQEDIHRENVKHYLECLSRQTSYSMNMEFEMSDGVLPFLKNIPLKDLDREGVVFWSQIHDQIRDPMHVPSMEQAHVFSEHRMSPQTLKRRLVLAYRDIVDINTLSIGSLALHYSVIADLAKIYVPWASDRSLDSVLQTQAEIGKLIHTGMPDLFSYYGIAKSIHSDTTFFDCFLQRRQANTFDLPMLPSL